MKKIKTNKKINPDPYEDMLRSEKLDPYESLIKPNFFNKKANESIEK